jgi:major membrane immunogen (membrane-anchored lipoprotein)
MKQHKWYRQIVIVIGLSLLLVGCGSNSVCVNGKMYYQDIGTNVYFRDIDDKRECINGTT